MNKWQKEKIESLKGILPSGNRSGYSDAEIFPWLIIINAIPEIYTTQSCWGHLDGDLKQDGDFPGKGILWIRFQNDIIPTSCPIEHKVLLNRERFPVLEVCWNYKDVSSLNLLISWLSDIYL